jgi:hypothetical protein
MGGAARALGVIDGIPPARQRVGDRFLILQQRRLRTTRCRRLCTHYARPAATWLVLEPLGHLPVEARLALAEAFLRVDAGLGLEAFRAPLKVVDNVRSESVRITARKLASCAA